MIDDQKVRSNLNHSATVWPLHLNTFWPFDDGLCRRFVGAKHQLHGEAINLGAF